MGTDNKTIRVTVWNEYAGEQQVKAVTDIYPRGLHVTIAEFLNKEPGISAKTSIITDDEQGLTEAVLDNTDVMIWWGHMLHDKVEDRFVQRVIERVQGGMGIVFLHSAHKSKPFMRLLGTTGRLCWRDGDKERLWTAAPAHPIAAGVPESFTLDCEEMYGEPFGIPEPQTTVFIGWFSGGNVFRSGVTFQRDGGRIFYFQPGHESNPTYHNEHVQKIITNAVKWANPVTRIDFQNCPMVKPVENAE
jgi:trehalose utilization protein